MRRPRHTVELRGRALGAAMLVCLVAAPRIARADTLALDAPEACASRAAFVSAVRQRTALASFAPGSGGRTFRVALAPSSAGGPEPWIGTLEVTDAQGAKTSRLVDGATCDEVADALSLVVALTIDPNAATPTPPTPPTAPIDKKDAAELPAGTPAGSIPRPFPAPPRRTFEWQVALESVLGAGAAPSPTLGAGLDLGVSQKHLSLIPLQLGGHARAAVEKTVFSARAPSADMVRAVAVLSLCPLTLRLGPSHAELCAGLGAGIARFEGEGAATPSAKLRFWSHVEGALVGTIPLGSTWFVTVRGSLEVPLTRDELVFVRPDVFVHRAAPITGNVGVGLGVRL